MGWLRRRLLCVCVLVVLGAANEAIPLPSSVTKDQPRSGIPYGAVKAKPTPKPSMSKLPIIGWQCLACMDTAAATHKVHAQLTDVLPTALLRARSGQASADLGVRLGCMALPVAERTPCHSLRYTIAASESKSFEAAAYAAARESEMATREANVEELEMGEIRRYTEVLKAQNPEKVTRQEREVLEAVATKEGMRQALAAAADVFRACSKMSFCDSEDEANGCGRALQSDTCLAAGDCTPAKKACKQRCRHCAWVLRSWPVWQGDCAALVNPKRKVSTSSSSPSTPTVTGDTPVEGLLSPDFEAAARKKPRTEEELHTYCWALSWSMQDLPDAEQVVAGGAGSMGQQFMGPYPWSPVLACACLGQCPYSSAESLMLHDAGCLGPSSAREVEAWRRRFEEEAEGGARMYREQMAREREQQLGKTWFDFPKDLQDARTAVRQTALEDKGHRTFEGGAIDKGEMLDKVAEERSDKSSGGLGGFGL